MSVMRCRALLARAADGASHIRAADTAPPSPPATTGTTARRAPTQRATATMAATPRSKPLAGDGEATFDVAQEPAPSTSKPRGTAAAKHVADAVADNATGAAATTTSQMGAEASAAAALTSRRPASPRDEDVRENALWANTSATARSTKRGHRDERRARRTP
jgi:hypothetical protein